MWQSSSVGSPSNGRGSAFTYEVTIFVHSAGDIVDLAWSETLVPISTRTGAGRALAGPADAAAKSARAAADAARNRAPAPAVELSGGTDKDMSALPDVSQSNWQQEVLSSDQPVLVDFWAPWCGPCRMLAPVVEKVAKAHAGRMKFVKLNTDENPSIGGTYHVSGIPCLILFKGGQAVDRIVGFVPEGTINSMLAKHLAAA